MYQQSPADGSGGLNHPVAVTAAVATTAGVTAAAYNSNQESKGSPVKPVYQSADPALASGNVKQYDPSEYYPGYAGITEPTKIYAVEESVLSKPCLLFFSKLHDLFPRTFPG